MIYANSMNTEIRAKLKLRSTSRGANNRLDVESIVSFDKADGISTPVMSKFAHLDNPADTFVEYAAFRHSSNVALPFVSDAVFR